jgi:hypothetical protein
MKKAQRKKVDISQVINQISNVHIACAGFASSSNAAS